MPSITDVLNHHGVPTKTIRPGWVQTACPFCSHLKSHRQWYLGINLRTNHANCWNCGYHRLASVLALTLRVPEKEAWTLIRGLSAGRSEVIERKERSKLILPDGVGHLKECQRMYLKARNFNPRKLRQLWQIGGIGLERWLPWRIFIPIHLDGEIVSWTTRRITNKDPRYFSAPPDYESVSAKHLLYGEDYCHHGIIIHEGPTDVWRTGPGAVATLGTSFTNEQVARMVKYPIRVVCFDSSREAQQRAGDLADLLECYPGETYNIYLESGDDPATASPKELKELRRMLL